MRAMTVVIGNSICQLFDYGGSAHCDMRGKVNRHLAEYQERISVIASPTFGSRSSKLISNKGPNSFDQRQLDKLDFCLRREMLKSPR